MRPVAASQTLTVRSVPAEARREPSGLKQTPGVPPTVTGHAQHFRREIQSVEPRVRSADGEEEAPVGRKLNRRA